MAERVAAASGRWWRYSRYEIHDGVIRPAIGAAFEAYDPWLTFDSAAESPWVRLFRIVGEIEADSSALNPVSMPSSVQSSLLNWCAEFGLLGVMSHEILAIRLWPRVMPESSLPDLVGYPDPTVWHKVVLTYSRFGADWGQSFRSLGALPVHDGGEPPEHLKLVASNEMPEYAIQPRFLAGVDHFDPITGQFKTSSLGEALGPYFPDVPAEDRDTFLYPMPHGERFWQDYAEPLDVFMERAKDLRDVVLDLERASLDSHLGPQLDYGSKTALARINSRYLVDISPSLEPKESGWQVSWSGPSLLSHLAMMAALELANPGRVLRRCPICGNLFVAKSSKATYCSPTCRHTGQKRRQRQAQRK